MCILRVSTKSLAFTKRSVPGARIACRICYRFEQITGKNSCAICHCKLMLAFIYFLLWPVQQHQQMQSGRVIGAYKKRKGHPDHFHRDIITATWKAKEPYDKTYYVYHIHDMSCCWRFFQEMTADTISITHFLDTWTLSHRVACDGDGVCIHVLGNRKVERFAYCVYTFIVSLHKILGILYSSFLFFASS